MRYDNDMLNSLKGQEGRQDMTVAVSCNLSDGVILGVDSAVSIPSPSGIAKVYENAEKLFQIGERPIGVAIFGLGGIEARSIGSYLRQFEAEHRDIVLGQNTIGELVEAIRLFFLDKYNSFVLPAIEKAVQEKGKKLQEIPKKNWPELGVVIGGFSHGEYLSEVWELRIPRDEAVNSARQRRGQGSFGTNWFSLFDPIQRYIKGYDIHLLNALLAYFEKLRGTPYSEQEKEEIGKIVKSHEYNIPFAAMPIEEGVAHTRFLVEFVINHYRYVSGPEVVGGKVKLGKVTYKGEKFQLLSD
jgi:hypothetical protein